MTGPSTAATRAVRRRPLWGFVTWIASRAADILMPPVCLSCQVPLDRHHALCAACWRDVAFIRPPLCDVTGIPLPFDTGGRMVSARAQSAAPAYDRARAVAHHAGTIRHMIHSFKYADRHDARPLFGQWLAEAGRELLIDADVIVPVPMSRLRLIMRHYNQAAVLAHELSRLTGVPVLPTTLRRSKARRRQVGLTRSQRIENVAGAFQVPARRRSSVRGKSVLLVDDVITTGATVEACARALKRAGASRVDVLALGLVCDTVILPA